MPNRTSNAYELLFEHIESMVCTLDLQGRFTSLNAAGERLTGYRAAEVVGRPATDLIAPELRADAVERFRRRVGGETAEAPDESALVTRDGARIPIAVTSTLFYEDGRPVGILGIVRDLSETRRAEEALLQSERRFRRSFESSAIGMALVGTDGRFIEVNASLCNLVGYPADELVAKTFQEITHPDDLDLDLEYTRRMLAGEIASYQMEKRYIHADGATVVWILLSVSLVRAGDGTPLHFVSHIEDITARKDAEQRLADAEQRYRTLVEQLPLGVYVRPLALDEANLYASPQVEPMLGYPAEEWQTNPALFAGILHPDDRERVLEECARVRETGRPLHLEYRCVARDGRTVWVQDETYVVHDAAGEPLYVQGFLLDITQRKQAEAERDRLRDQLHHAQKLEAVGRLAGGIAHDFNNMLTGIKGYSELLLAGLGPSSPLRREAEQIKRAAEQASTLPRQLLAFSRKQVLEPQVVDLDEVVADASDLLGRLIGASVQLVVRGAAAPAVVEADPSQLEQLLLNLAVNARHAMPRGGRLTISTRCEQVPADFASQHEAAPGRYVVLSVEDTGVGMDDETRARAFEPFFTTKPQGEGSGLGLASAYGIVRQSGGFIAVESEPGRGSRFDVYFPAADAAAGGRRRTVLVVEDEEIVRDLVRLTLERAGYDVLPAASGEAALELLASGGARIDLLVTDMVMPGINGAQLARRVLEGSPRLPVVFMSGYSDEAVPPAPDGSPVGVLLQKPFSTAALVARVEEALGAPGGEITCVVADDHPAVLDSVSRYLEAAGIRVLARLARGDEAIAAIEAHRPTIALLDVGMQPVGGIDVARRVGTSAPGTSAVLYTGRRDDALLEQALDAGARGFVLKEGPLDELSRALTVVAAGETYVDPGLSRAVASPRALSTISPLTERERQVLALVADGYTNDRAAAKLGISAETVQSHVRNAMGKLDADSRTQAVATALRHALID